MRGLIAWSAPALVCLVAGCGQSHALPAACHASPADVVRALRRAPGAVTLGGSVPLSSCVAHATDTGPLQDVGAAYTEAALRLAGAARGSDRSALELGYLVGATERGARRTQGVHAELIARLEGILGIDGPPRARRAAYAAGRAAGLRAG